MDRLSIYDYFFAKITVNSRLVDGAVDYLIRNQDMLLDTAQASAVFKTRSMVTTPMAQIFNKAVLLGDDKAFTLLGRSRTIRAVPELLTMRHLPFDLKQMSKDRPELAQAVAALSQLKDKIVLNSTQMMRATGELSDTPGFQNLVVRDLLSRSFYASGSRNTWLNPGLTQFVCKIYSMSLAASVAQWYNLDHKTQGFVTAVFAYFYLSQMMTADAAQASLMSRWKDYLLPEPKDLSHIFSVVGDVLGKKTVDSLDDAFVVIDTLGVDRLKIDRNILLRKMANLGPDLHTSSLALEYPPYFIYLILLALSGAKIGLSFRMKNSNMAKDGLRFADDLLNTNGFLGLVD